MIGCVLDPASYRASDGLDQHRVAVTEHIRAMPSEEIKIGVPVNFPFAHACGALDIDRVWLEVPSIGDEPSRKGSARGAFDTAFEKAAQKVSGCVECHVVTGEFDYFMLVRTRDNESFNRLHAEQLLYLPGVRQVRSFMVLKEILSTHALPL